MSHNGTTAQTSTGATTQDAAQATTAQGPPPSVAAPAIAPIANTANQTSGPGKKNYSAKKYPGADGIGKKTTGLAQVLAAFSDQPFTAVKHTAHTYIVPSFVFFFQILAVMDQQMVRTKRFTDANSDWHPYVSHLYFTVLIFYWTLKCESTATQLSQTHLDFIDYMERNFNATQLLIPGPLVPFFQSLASNAGPYSTYGNLIFAIPNDLGVTQANEFRYANRLNAILPNMIFAIDQFIQLLVRIAPQAAVVNVTLETTDTMYTHIFGTAANNGAVNRFCMMNPIGRAPINQTVTLLSGLQANADQWLDVLPYDSQQHASIYTTGNNQTLLEFDQILGFRGVGNFSTRLYGWFEHTARIMQPYATFFRDSCSLGSVSTIGIGIGYVLTTYPQTPTNENTLVADVTTRDVRHRAAGVARYITPSYNSVFTTSSYSEENLDLVAEQMGMYTQLNVNWTPINGSPNAVFLGPLRGNVAIGPIEQRSTKKTSAIIDARQAVVPFISGYYHMPTAGKLE